MEGGGRESQAGVFVKGCLWRGKENKACKIGACLRYQKTIMVASVAGSVCTSVSNVNREEVREIVEDLASRVEGSGLLLGV